MFIGVAVFSKAIKRVNAHVRAGRPVIAYVQRGRPRLKDQRILANELAKLHFGKIMKWSAESVFHYIQMGEHVPSVDDAQTAGMEFAYEALLRFRPSKGGTLETYVRPQIRFGILQYLRDWRSRGMTGVRALYAKVSSAKTSDEKERLIGEFPHMEDIGEHSAFSPGSDDVIEAAQALLSRDEILDNLDRELRSNLALVKLRLQKIEKNKGTWKNKTFAKRKLQVFRYKFLNNMSFREVASKMGMDVSQVHKAYGEVRKILNSLHVAIPEARDLPADLHGRAVHEQAATFREGEHWDTLTNRWIKREGGPVKQWKEMSPTEQDNVRRRVGLKKSLGDFRRERIRWNLERLKRAVDKNYPEAHIDFLIDVLAGLIAEFDVDGKP